MGIPSFFRHIVARYNQDVIQNVLNASGKEGRGQGQGQGQGLQCDRFFIDFNCILHKCAQDVSSRFTTLPLELLEEMIMKDSIRFTEYLRSIVKPGDLTYIAIDGVCPRAKMVQQRKRRYISSMRKRLVEGNPDYQKNTNTDWNSNAITPGTKFMSDFDIKIKNYYKNNPGVIISGSDEFGEGEHKIFRFVKDAECDRKDIIYGLDADLILLSMLNLSKTDTIRLLREVPEFRYQSNQANQEKENKQNNNIHSQNMASQVEFCLLDINNLHQSIEKYYQVEEGSMKESISPSSKGQFIRDYIVLCTFLGNDFLPPLSYIKVKDNGIDYIIQMYKDEVQKSGRYLVDLDGKINDSLLLSLFKKLSSSEDQNMSHACEHYFSRKTPYTSLQSYQKIFWELDNYPSINKMRHDVIDTKNKGWRTQYYNALFGKDLVVTDLCQNYLEGLKWVVDYYVNQNPILDWSYKYSYSPTILDLMNHLQFEMRVLDNEILEFDDSKKSNSINNILDTNNLRSSILSNEAFTTMMTSGSLQLLLVLPPCSKHLIPDERKADLMTNLSLGCLHFYPRDFKISTFLKSFIWECSAILPDLDISYLYKKYQTM